MEAAPPSYEKATLVDFWDIIAQYVPSNDLCSAALVSRSWHSTFVSHLWGNPASHFGIENDRVYVALIKFKRTLQTARLLVRSLTHTLHLPPAHAEIYNGPNADWLRDILERLPNLQSLIVRGLPFFDHAALQALRHQKPKANTYGVPEGIVELPASSGFAFEASASTTTSFGLRLLDASRCSNVTAHGLAQGLGRFENLLYLDMSFTYAARDVSVLETLRRFSGLQVLKLRGISLTDEALQILAHAIGLTVRSLDIRDNQVTDRGVRTLLDRCFAIHRAQPNGTQPGSTGQATPSLLPYLGSEMLRIYQGEDFEGYLRSTFTGNFVSRLAIEDAPSGGITHLYISGNALTAEGASGLVRSGRLHVLDVGSVTRGLARHPSLSRQHSEETEVSMPGVEKLMPVFSRWAAEALTFLRIDHALLTKEILRQHPNEVVQDRVELADTALPVLPDNAFELDGSSTQPEAVELPTVTTPRAELPGDPMQIIISPAMSDPPKTDEDDDIINNGARRGSAFAPEVLESLVAGTERINLLSPVSALENGTMDSTISGFNPTTPPGSPSQSPTSAISTSQPRRPRSYSSLTTERTARVKAHIAAGHNLHPAMLSHLSTLILTDVPPFAPDAHTADRIIGFIRNCAEEAWLARRQAKLDYSLPPGRKGHASAQKESANKIFGLQRLVLELASEQNMRRNNKASPWQHSTTRSMTEDRDSEALWSAAETDFSFFGDGEECGLPSFDPSRAAHFVGSDEKEVSVSGGFTPAQKTSRRNAPPAQPKFDTIAKLSSFRKERKLAHQRNVAAGADDPETEGYWEGLVQVVRPGTGLRSDEDVDYYGNRFSVSGVYR